MTTTKPKCPGCGGGNLVQRCQAYTFCPVTSIDTDGEPKVDRESESVEYRQNFEFYCPDCDVSSVDIKEFIPEESP